MAGYTKLFSSILDSTVWDTPLHVKVTWVTMLAMADRDGLVEASVPGLAKRAGVSLAQCEEALARFLAPDPYSRTKDLDGRRIEEIDGGWRLVNHAKYRHKASQEEAREKNAERQRRHKARKANESGRGNAELTLGNARALPVTPNNESNDIADPSPKAEADPPKVPLAANAALELFQDEPKPKRPDAVAEVFEHWKRVMASPRSQLDSKRRALIARALKLYSAADCMAAIDGCAASDFHMGREPGKPSKYNGVELIFRSADKIDFFLSKAPSAPMASPATPARGPVPSAGNTDPAGIEAARAKLRAQREQAERDRAAQAEREARLMAEMEASR